VTAPAFKGTGTPEDPWTLSTPPGKSEFVAYRDAVQTLEASFSVAEREARRSVSRG